jgi:hypothetical protein
MSCVDKCAFATLAIVALSEGHVMRSHFGVHLAVLPSWKAMPCIDKCAFVTLAIVAFLEGHVMRTLLRCFQQCCLPGGPWHEGASGVLCGSILRGALQALDMRF